MPRGVSGITCIRYIMQCQNYAIEEPAHIAKCMQFDKKFLFYKPIRETYILLVGIILIFGY